MLTIYRRHRAECPHADDRISRKCRCALWATGTIEGKPVRESLKTRNWERAEQLKRERESGTRFAELPSITVDFAIQKYYESCEARRLSSGTLRKYRTFRSVLTKFARKNGIVLLTSFGQQQVRDFVNERKLGALSAVKEIERLRTFFNFCVENDWLAKNVARVVKAPRVRVTSRTPFTDKEIEKILANAQNDREIAFVLTLRNTGLRIGDASLLKRSDLTDNRIHLYTSKSGTPVSVVIPPTLGESARSRTVFRFDPERRSGDREQCSELMPNTIPV